LVICKQGPSRLTFRLTALERGGFGIELIHQSSERMGQSSMPVLLAAAKAVDYDPKFGFTKPSSAWTRHASDPTRSPVIGEIREGSFSKG
jgi:hypothetical protein